jgi:hypothetical protein
MDPARRAQLGRKWQCHSCDRKFYDLGKEVAVCPNCGEKPGEASESSAAPARGGRKKTARARSKSSR